MALKEILVFVTTVLCKNHIREHIKMNLMGACPFKPVNFLLKEHVHGSAYPSSSVFIPVCR